MHLKRISTLKLCCYFEFSLIFDHVLIFMLLALDTGIQIAVKRLKVWSTKAEMEFAVEVEILGRVRHKNLLSLRLVLEILVQE